MKYGFAVLSIALAAALVSCNKETAGTVDAVKKFAAQKEIVFSVAGSKAVTVLDEAYVEAHGFDVLGQADYMILFNDHAAKVPGKDCYKTTGTYYYPTGRKTNFVAVCCNSEATLYNMNSSVSVSYVHNPDADLLVAVTKDVVESDGDVALNFEHVLSQMTIRAKAKTSDVDYRILYVKVRVAKDGKFMPWHGEWGSSSKENREYCGELLNLGSDAYTPLGDAMTFIPCGWGYEVEPVTITVRWVCTDKTTHGTVAEYEDSVDFYPTMGCNTDIKLTLGNAAATPISFTVEVAPWQTPDPVDVNFGGKE